MRFGGIEPPGSTAEKPGLMVWPDGRVEQLGWPRVEFSYRSGTRHPERARIHLTEPSGKPLTIDVDTLLGVALHVGAGYGGVMYHVRRLEKAGLVTVARQGHALAIHPIAEAPATG